MCTQAQVTKPTNLKMKLLSPKNSYGHPSYAKQNKTRGVSHSGLAIYIKKDLKAKE
jgi:hypothetical protein